MDCPIGAWVYRYGGMRNNDLSGPFFRLLLESWRQSPTGTLPTDNDFLAKISGLSVKTFIEVLEPLLDGFARSGTRLVCQELEERARVLVLHHGEALDRLSASITATALDPDHFNLHQQAGADERRARKRRLPDGFSVSPALAAWGISMLKDTSKDQGALRVPSDEQCKATLLAILETFCLDARANGRLYADWDGAYQNFATKQTNGVFGMTCASYMPDCFPLRVVPLPTQGVAARSSRPGFGPAARRDAIIEGSKGALDDVINQMLGGGKPQHDPNVVDMDVDGDIDLDAPLMRAGT